MATVKLRNRSRQSLVFNLEHATFVNQPGQNGVGKPESLTIFPRETVEVDEAALECVEVKNALKARNGVPGALQVVR